MSNAAVEELVAAIGNMDLEALRKAWGQRYGAPPPLRSVPILRMLLAWRVHPGSRSNPGATGAVAVSIRSK